MRRLLMHWPLRFLFFIILWSHAALAEDGGYFSDDSVSVRYGTSFREPAVAKGDDIIKTILNYQHHNTDALGSNFVYLDTLFSHANDPADDSTHGATEIYTVYRRDWSLRKITGVDVSGSGFLHDLALHMGGDANWKNSTFNPQKRFLLVGPELQFSLPEGYVNVAFDVAKEWGNNGIVHKKVSYDPTLRVEAVWGIPFRAAALPWKFTGFFLYTAPKGKDGFGSETRGEILTRPELLLKAGEWIGRQDALEIGVGYEYWRNKFGNDHKNVPGAFARTPMIIAKAHF